MNKTIKLRAGDKLTRQAMRSAHLLGRHGTAEDLTVVAPSPVLSYWAGTCTDCHAVLRYGVGMTGANQDRVPSAVRPVSALGVVLA